MAAPEDDWGLERLAAPAQRSDPDFFFYMTEIAGSASVSAV